MLISKKAATPMSKGSKKHSHPFTNIKISKNAQKSGHSFQYFAVPPRVHMDSTGLHMDSTQKMAFTGLESSPVHFFFFKAEFEK